MVKSNGFTQDAFNTKYAFNGVQRGARVRRQLERAGVRLSAPHTGRLKRLRAAVHLEADGCLRVHADADPPKCPLEALRTHAGLPGNVRYARRPDGWSVAAETRFSGDEAHLPDSLREISRGFRALLNNGRRTAKRQPQTPPAGDTLRAAVEESKALGADAVEIEGGWEVRPRINGEAIPVEVRIQQSGVRVACTLLAAVPEKPAGAAAADQALRLNFQLRLVRLAMWDGGALAAESCLRAELIGPEWLEMTVRAVAAAHRHAGGTLRVLAEQAHLAERYTELLLDT